MKTFALAAVVVLLVIEPGCMRQHVPSAAPPIPNNLITLQAGTTLALRTAEVIDSSSSSPGQTFAAVVSRDISDATGQTVLPTGCPATLVLLVSPLSSAKKGAFELRIASVTLNGDSYLVRNPSAGNSTVPGASLGAFLGGVQGTDRLPSTEENTEKSRQITLSGEKIWVPVGSLLTFRLDRQVRLIGSH